MLSNKEAQNLIARNRSVFQYDPEMLEALDLAIKALEKGDRYNEGYLAGQACAKWRSGV